MLFQQQRLNLQRRARYAEQVLNQSRVVLLLILAVSCVHALYWAQRWLIAPTQIPKFRLIECAAIALIVLNNVDR